MPKFIADELAPLIEKAVERTIREQELPDRIGKAFDRALYACGNERLRALEDFAQILNENGMKAENVSTEWVTLWKLFEVLDTGRDRGFIEIDNWALTKVSLADNLDADMLRHLTRVGHREQFS
jgi:hypothetical protein